METGALAAARDQGLGLEGMDSQVADRIGYMLPAGPTTITP